MHCGRGTRVRSVASHHTSVLILIPILISLSSPVHAQDWDPAPFRSATPIPRDGLPPERGAFLAWLDHNSSLTQQSSQRARERLYAYISDLAKRQGGGFPRRTDTAAFNLFRVAAGTGATGADRVARALRPSAKLPPPAAVPAFTLALTPPLFRLASDDGTWGVCYPYYFMAAPVGRQRPSNGVLTEVVVLSTLFAPDQGQPGSSQATILLAAAPVADSAKHVAAWLAQLGVKATSAPPEDRTGAWYASPPADPMHRLVVIHRLPARVMVIAYLGLGGTFETNRPHFFNLLTTVRSGRCA